MSSPDPNGRRHGTPIILCAVISIVLLYTVVDGVRGGWYEWLPGSMSRHRDAVAVGITAIADGKWQGYASYRAVNRTLREGGLSVQKEDLVRVGAEHYFDVMTDPARLDAALKAAASVDMPASEGMYYSQDEKGMAIFYTIAFALFGISTASWYWFYMLLYSLSVLAACLAFRQHREVLFFFLIVVCAQAITSHLLPTIPRQDINVIHGNRFLGIMGSVAVFHLMFLVLQRKRPTVGQLVLALFQTAIICCIVNARTSAAWLPISLTMLWAGVYFVQKIKAAHVTLRVPPGSWPVGMAIVGVAALLLHQKMGQDPAFRDGRAYGAHVFWHNLVTALHNNPLRTERYGIPSAYPIYDDQVAFLVFDREINRRGEDERSFLIRDPDWVYRTDDPNRDLRWAAYDSVLRDIFFRTIAADPAYAAYSFGIQQPLSALSVIFGPNFFRAHGLPLAISIGALILSLIVVVMKIPFHPGRDVPILAAATFSAALPVMSAAAVELRVVELFYVLLVDVLIGAAMLFATLNRRVLAIVSAKGRPRMWH